MKSLHLLLFFSILVFFGCKSSQNTTSNPSSAGNNSPKEQLMPWTMKVARDYNLTIEDQFQVQYFTAGGQIVLDDLVLMKEKNVTSEGVIELKKTPAVQQVRIQNNTPGVMDSIHLDAKNVPLILFVRVEQDGVNRFLPFVHAANDYYYFALNAPIKNGKLQIKYDNITYSASPSCRNVYLAVKINEQSNPATITRDAQGVRINQGDSLH